METIKKSWTERLLDNADRVQSLKTSFRTLGTHKSSEDIREFVYDALYVLGDIRITISDLIKTCPKSLDPSIYKLKSTLTNIDSVMESLNDQFYSVLHEGVELEDRISVLESIILLKNIGYDL